MTTVYDRYLMWRFLHVFFVGFFAIYGLYVVIDGFTNVDAFQAVASNGDEADSTSILGTMGVYYLFRAFEFFNVIGPILTVISVMVVFAMLQRSSEIKPILAAGVPTYRLVIPLVIGVCAVNALLALNQELIIPQISHRLQASRGTEKPKDKSVQPVLDRLTRMHIAGNELNHEQRMMTDADFTSRPGDLTTAITKLRADEAVHVEDFQGHGSGWLLKNAEPAFAEIELTERGRRFVLPVPESNDIFVVSSVDFDQLYYENLESRYASSAELIRRIRSPSAASRSLRAQTICLHERLTRPLASIAAVFVTIPLIVRREGVGFVGNLAVCTAVLGLLLGVSQGAMYLGKMSLIGPEFAVWCPIITSGSIGAWLSGMVQT